MNLNGLQQRQGQRCGAQDAAHPRAAGSVPCLHIPGLARRRGGCREWEKGKRTRCGICLRLCNPSDGVPLGLVFRCISRDGNEEAEEQPCYCASGLQWLAGERTGKSGLWGHAAFALPLCHLPRGCHQLTVYLSVSRLSHCHLTPTLHCYPRVWLGLRSAN